MRVFFWRLDVATFFGIPGMRIDRNRWIEKRPGQCGGYPMM
jgi:hypothetical protein